MLAMRALPPTLSPTVAPSMELVRHAAAELAEHAHDLPPQPAGRFRVSGGFRRDADGPKRRDAEKIR